MPNDDLDCKYLWSRVGRHWSIWAIGFLLTGLVSVAAVLLAPSTFDATALFVVDSRYMDTKAVAVMAKAQPSVRSATVVGEIIEVKIGGLVLRGDAEGRGKELLDTLRGGILKVLPLYACPEKTPEQPAAGCGSLLEASVAEYNALVALLKEIPTTQNWPEVMPVVVRAEVVIREAFKWQNMAHGQERVIQPFGDIHIRPSSPSPQVLGAMLGGAGVFLTGLVVFLLPAPPVGGKSGTQQEQQ